MGINSEAFWCKKKHMGGNKFFFFEQAKRKRNRSNSKTALFFRLVVFQCVLCAVVAAGVLLAGASQKMQDDYRNTLKSGEDKAPVAHTAEAVYSAADFEVVTAKITVDSAKAESCNYDDVIAVGKITDSGGEDIGSEQAIKGTSFASYTVSAPVTTPVQGRLTSPFGYRINPVSGNYGFHTGIDIAAAAGTPVAAAYGGRVTDTGESDVWGKYVLIEHSDGFETYYCHLNEIYVSEGTILRKGETLGLVGSTGWSTGPHLHFEVRIDGVRVDPEPLIYPDEN